VTTEERFYDPERVLAGAMHAMEIARRHGAAQIEPQDLLAGMLLAVARFGIVEFGTQALDLAGLDLPFDLPSPDTTVRPHYSAAAAEVFTRAARICRGDGGGPLRPLHLLVALGDPGLAPMQRAWDALGVDAAGWRRLLAGIEPDGRTAPPLPGAFAQSPPPRSAAAGASGHPAPAGAAEDLLSPEQAAAELGVHIQTLRGYIRRGKLAAFRLAGERAIRIRRSDLQALLARPVGASRAPAHGVPSTQPQE
jgi:excisionase family DNA binding protein